MLGLQKTAGWNLFRGIWKHSCLVYRSSNSHGNTNCRYPAACTVCHLRLRRQSGASAQWASAGQWRHGEVKADRKQVGRWDKEQQERTRECLQAPRVYKYMSVLAYCVRGPSITCVGVSVWTKVKERRLGGERNWFHTSKVQSWGTDSLLTPAAVRLYYCVYTLRLKQMEQRNTAKRTLLPVSTPHIQA